MKIKIAGIIAIIIFFIACNKDKFQTKPQISVKSYNTKEVSLGQNLVITFDYTDQEGDLAKGKFVYYPKRLNVRPYLPTYIDSIISVLDDNIPKKNKGLVDLTLGYQALHRSDAENDTIQFHFVLVDAAGNRSDSVKSDKIVIINVP